MAILKDGRFWAGVVVGAVVVPMALRMMTSRKAG